MPKRKKAELYDIIQRIVYLYEEEKKDFRTIASLLRSEGYDISRSTIHRAYRDYKELAKRYNEWWDKIKILVEQTQNKPTSFMLSALVSILTQHVLEFVKDIEFMEFEEPGELIKAVKELTQMTKSLEEYISAKLQKAVEKIEEEGKKRNIDPEFLKLVKEEIYGV
jgi:hypothetical protein